jgi:glycosyltransferase involved in cell wall biosynthesis
MISEQLTLTILLGTIAVFVLISVVSLVGSSIYDVREIKKKKNSLIHPYSKELRARPLVTIIINCLNDEKVINRCLTSINRSTYRNYEVILIDRNSNDNTKRYIKDFIDQYSQKTIYLISKRKRHSKNNVIYEAYRRRGNGSLIMVLDANCSLDKNALKNLVKHFNTEYNISLLTCNRRIDSSFSLIGFIQNFEKLLNIRLKKSSDVFNAEYLLSAAGTVYNANIFKILFSHPLNAHIQPDRISLPLGWVGNKINRSYYANDVVIQGDPLPNFYRLLKEHYRQRLDSYEAMEIQKDLFFTLNKECNKFLTWLLLPITFYLNIVLVAVPILLTYFIYLAFRLHQPYFFIITCAIFTLLLIFAISEDSNLKFRQKLRLCFLIPATYAVFYLTTFIYIPVLLKIILNSIKSWPTNFFSYVRN